MISHASLLTLKGNAFVDDNVINGYLKLLLQRHSSQPATPKVWIMKTYFYPMLKTRGHAGVREWFNESKCPGSILSYDLIIVPIHLPGHWACGILDLRQKGPASTNTMEVIDSCHAPCTKHGTPNPDFEHSFVEIMTLFMEEECKSRAPDPITQTPMKWTNITGAHLFNTPSQYWDRHPRQSKSGMHCALFLIKAAEARMKDCGLSYSDRQMPDYRRQLALELGNGTLSCPNPNQDQT